MKISFIDKISLLLFSILFLMTTYLLYAGSSGQFVEHKDWVNAVDVNKADLIAGASGNEIFLWKKRKGVGKLVGHSENVLSVAFTNAGKEIATGSLDNSVLVWSVSEKKVLKTLIKHNRGIKELAFSKSDKYLITAGFDNKLIVWNWKNNKVVREFKIIDTHFSISRTDVLAYLDDSKCLVYFDLKTLQFKKPPVGFCGLPQFDPNSDQLAVINNVVTVVDVNSGKVLSTLDIAENHNESVLSSYQFTPDSKYFVATFWDGDIDIWNLQTGQLFRTLRGHDLNMVEDVAFNDKNQLISASSDRTIKVWNWETGDLKMVLGDNSMKEQLVGFWAISFLLTLIFSFSAIAINSSNKISAYLLLTILSLWTFGVGAVMYYFRSNVTRYATMVTWTSTVISILFFFTFYFSWLAIFSIPVALLFSYLKMTADVRDQSIDFPLFINLTFCTVIVGFIVSQIWR